MAKDWESHVANGRLDYAKALASVLAGRLRTGARCTVHGSVCVAPVVHIDMSGSLCAPWTSASRAIAKLRSHPLVWLLMHWCALLRKQPVRVAVHENVLGFDESVLHENLADMYWIYSLRVAPSDAGFPFLRRPRIYNILYHKASTRVVHDVQALYQAVSNHMRYPAAPHQLTWIWWARPEECLAEENRHRRGLAARTPQQGPSPN